MTLFKANLGEGEFDIFVAAKDWYFDGKDVMVVRRDIRWPEERI